MAGIAMVRGSFGRSIDRPFIEATRTWWTASRRVKFGRSIDRPFIEAVIVVFLPSRVSEFGRSIDRPFIEAACPCRRGAPTSCTFGRSIDRPFIEALVRFRPAGLVSTHLADQLIGPSLKPVRASHRLRLDVFGRSIDRPFIEASRPT